VKYTHDKNGEIINREPEESDWKHFNEVIRPKYESQGKEVPWYLEPDAFEGWKP
jgi:hypothetical protein